MTMPGLMLTNRPSAARTEFEWLDEFEQYLPK